jgi:hypothetical protein
VVITRGIEREEKVMNFPWWKPLVRMLVLGLVAAAVGASGAASLSMDQAIEPAANSGVYAPVNDYGPGTAHPDYTLAKAPAVEPYDYGSGTAHPDYAPAG